MGIAGAMVFGYLHKRIKDPLLDNALSLLIPFAVVIASEGSVPPASSPSWSPGWRWGTGCRH